MGSPDEGVPVRDFADVPSQRLNVPVVAKSQLEAANHDQPFPVFAPR